MPLVGHVPQSMRLTEVIDAGQPSIEHLDGWLGELLPAAERGETGAGAR